MYQFIKEKSYTIRWFSCEFLHIHTMKFEWAQYDKWRSWGEEEEVYS